MRAHRAHDDRRRVLITAGPTREYLDPVRYLSNDSSGRTGFALAKIAKRRGFDVTLIAGPSSLPTPKGVKRIDVVSAREMYRVSLQEAKRAGLIIMAAAVSDFRPMLYSTTKIKKARNNRVIALTENPDILLHLCRHRPKGQIIVGFALETLSLKKRALQKLHHKGCDWIVANDVHAIGERQSKILVIHHSGTTFQFPLLPKEKLAKHLLSIITD